MPYKSKAQQSYFHTASAKAKGITSGDVAKFDRESKGMKLPRKVSKGRPMSGKR